MSVEKWWKPDVSPRVLREFLQLEDLPGILFFGGWLTLVVLTGYVTWQLRDTAAFFPLECVYGTVLTFAYACSHECAHRTAFRSRWLNETVYYLSSFIFGQEPMYRRYTHMSHHAKTWYPDKDLQMDYLNPITLLGYVHATSGLPVWRDVVTTMPRHALGRLSRAELDVIPQAEVRKLVWGSRAFLGGYAALAATAVFAKTLSPLYLFFLPRFLGGWVVNFFINTQHMCMAQSRPDHRATTRSVDCSYLSRFLYWNMNYHLEHHLFPGVPFHSLAALSKTLGPQLPIADSGFLRSNLGILRIVIKQRRDPALVAVPRYRGETLP